MSRNPLYILFLTLSLTGYAWVFWNLSRVQSTGNPVIFCLFKKITHLPCPSCGTTHSVLAIMKGDLPGAAKENPLGFIVFPALLIFPVWILFDLFLKRDSFFKFYHMAEAFISRKWVAYPAIFLLFVNWLIILLFHFRSQ
jgi:hypothetical protein